MFGRVRSAIIGTVLATIALMACGDDSGDRSGVIQPKGPDPTAAPASGRTIHTPVVTIGSRRVQYRESKRACRLLGPARIAYENDEAGTVTEIAKKWAERTAVKPAWRQATYEGCMAGFRQRAARGRVLGGDLADVPGEDRDYIMCLTSRGVSVLINPTTIRLAKEARRGSRTYRYSYGFFTRNADQRGKQLRAMDACRAKHWQRR
jgi:hypothetical protein